MKKYWGSVPLSDSTQPLKLTSDLEPLPYHLAVREYLKTEESELWDWFGKPRLTKGVLGGMEHGQLAIEAYVHRIGRCGRAGE